MRVQWSPPLPWREGESFAPKQEPVKMNRHRREASGGRLQFGLTGMRVARRRDEFSDRTV